MHPRGDLKSGYLGPSSFSSVTLILNIKTYLDYLAMEKWHKKNLKYFCWSTQCKTEKDTKTIKSNFFIYTPKKEKYNGLSQVKMLVWINLGISKYQVQGYFLEYISKYPGRTMTANKDCGLRRLFFGCSNTGTSKHVSKIWVRPSSWLHELSLASSPSVTEKKLLTAKLVLKAFLLGLKYFKSSDTSVTWSFQAILSWKKIINHIATPLCKTLFFVLIKIDLWG